MILIDLRSTSVLSQRVASQRPNVLFVVSRHGEGVEYATNLCTVMILKVMEQANIVHFNGTALLTLGCVLMIVKFWVLLLQNGSCGLIKNYSRTSKSSRSTRRGDWNQLELIGRL